MTDFHTHILPGIDDGSKSPEMSLQMLAACAEQGVDTVVCTPHFYADCDEPAEFLENRKNAILKLKEYVERLRLTETVPGLPVIYLGAEVYFFSSMSYCEELPSFAIGSSGYILVEPPMTDWTETIIGEIEAAGHNFNLMPVIAHVDRYIESPDDSYPFDVICGRDMLCQVNASFFINPETRDMALYLLSQGRIHAFGSDCHNMTGRSPNLGPAADIITAAGLIVPEIAL